MKHIWVVESSGGRKWRPAATVPYAYLTKRSAKARLSEWDRTAPGLKWRVAKYERVK